MKQILKVISMLAFFLICFSVFGCKAETETEYITKTETAYVEKNYAKPVIFTAEDVAGAGVKVTMSTATKGAKIYYTTDGIEPTEKNILYSSPVNFIKDVTVKAVAIKTGMENSPVAVATVSMTEKTVTVEVEKEPDTTPPGKVVLAENAAVAGNGKVLLSWKNPGDEDFYGTRVLFTPAVEDVTQPLVIKGEDSGNSSILIKGLENETEYTFSLIALDKNQNESETVVIKATPVTPPDTSDKIAPGEVLNLSALPFNKRVKLEWNDPSDEDLFGIEVSWAEVSDGSRAVSAMDEKSLFVAPDMGCIEVPVLENDVEYQFSVKTMDVSGNKSAGVIIKSTPIPSEPLKIELRVTEEKSDSVMVTADIFTTAQNIEKVVCKKTTSESAVKLLSDSDAIEMKKNATDFSEWTLEINVADKSSDGIYTVAAIDCDGRAETAQFKINNFFIPPEKLELVSKKYERNESMITLVWKNPTDEYFDHVEITYKVNDETTISESPIIIPGDKNSIKLNKDFYRTYYIVSVDKLGNKSEPLVFKVYLNVFGFEKIPKVSIKGDEVWNPLSYVFVSGRSLEIKSFYMSDHPVTRGEYKEIIGHAPNVDMAYDASGNKLKGDDRNNNPVSCISWADAIIYCNKLSIKEGLKPCYIIDSKTDPDAWGERGGYTPSEPWQKVICNFDANGYRLPTEAEWEWAARGGECYLYAGSDNIKDVAWYYHNTNYGSGTRDVKTKAPNGYGLYDMTGNVFEWCWDWYIKTIPSDTPLEGPEVVDHRRCKRGGAYRFELNNRVFDRLGDYQNYYYEGGEGFRLVRGDN